MSKPLSLDLRMRVLAAISGGVSCREAAVRFGVSASSTIRWRALERRLGDAKAKAVGGDRRSEHMERHGDAIRSLVDETPDLTLEEIRTALAEQGVSASYKITRKKRPRTRPSRIARIS
jgi:transposase